jgi:uncharacterized protein YggU (UPF0235/DUF167 family)
MKLLNNIKKVEKVNRANNSKITHNVYMYIRALVFLNQRKEKIVETKTGYFEIYINAKTKHNEANKRLLELLISYFENPAGGVKIINGHRSRVKLLKIGNSNK